MFWIALPTRRPRSPSSSISPARNASGSCADDRDRADRRRPGQDRRDDAGVEPEGEELLLLVVRRFRHVLPVDRLPALDDVFHDRAFDRDDGSGRENPFGPLPGRREHAEPPVLEQDDRRALEWDQSPQLPDEGGERLLQVERRSERAGGPVRRVEDVGAPTQLVPQRLCLGHTVAGSRSLCRAAGRRASRRSAPGSAARRPGERFGRCRTPAAGSAPPATIR